MDTFQNHGQRTDPCLNSPFDELLDDCSTMRIQYTHTHTMLEALQMTRTSHAYNLNRTSHAHRSPNANENHNQDHYVCVDSSRM